MRTTKEALEKYFQEEFKKNEKRIFFKNNKVSLSGTVTKEFTFSHELYGEKFYKGELRVQRLSGRYDNIPLMISEKELPSMQVIGKPVEVRGVFKSYNLRDSEGRHLILYVHVKDFKVCDQVEELEDDNYIFLDGYICRNVIFRKTPLGREICDVLLAVNRAMGKSDYIPCIAWGTDAKNVSLLQVGDRIRVYGRIQSRTYEKEIGTGEKVSKEAYEVSLYGYEVK